MRVRNIFILLLPLLLLVVPPAQAREVLVVKNLTPQAGISKQIAAALSDVIKDSLSQHYNVQSLEDLAAIAGIKEEQLKAGCDDTKCILDVAGALNADLVVTGSLSKLGDTYRFSLRLIRARGENAGVQKRASEKCQCTEDQLIDAAERVALKLISKKPTVATPPVAPTVVSNPAKLYVDAEPPNALIRILNIPPKFEQGIELEAGRYHIEVSAPEHTTQRRWETLAEGETKRVSFALLKAPTGPRARFTNSIGQEFVYIKPGTFMMGSPAGEPGRFDSERQHQVTLTKGYYMQTTEVTQGQWRAVMGSNPSHFSNCGDTCPVEKVSWNDCQEFIRKLNQKEGTNKYRLPTEAEWEYAARAGTTGPYAGNLDSMGWYGKNSGRKTHPVAQKQANAWGLYDMHGNVWEWCQDWYGDYPTSGVTDPTGPFSGSNRVLRGGGWDGYARGCRSAARINDSPGHRSHYLGFRLSSRSSE